MVCLAVCCILALLGGASSQQGLPNVAELIASNPDMSEILAWINDTNPDLLSTIFRQAYPPLTVFLANNNAVLAFKKANTEIAENITITREIILNHVLLNVSIHASDVWYNMQAISVSMYPLWFDMFGQTITVNGVKIVRFDLMASNGIIHVIDDVIYPMGIRSSIGSIVGTMMDYVGFKSLVDRSPKVRAMTLNNSQMLTIFIPENNAIPDATNLSDSDVTDVLKRHMVTNNVMFSKYLNSRDMIIRSENGQLHTKHLDNELFVQNYGDLWSRVVSSKGMATVNGVIYRINGVLGLTSGIRLVEALGVNNLMKMKMQVQVTGMADALNDRTKNYTLLAPTDTAFDSMAKVADIFISTILSRHMVMGYIMMESLRDKQVLTTLNFEKIQVSMVNEKVFIEFRGIRAMVIATNKRAANGVIHVIDKVLSGSSSAHISTIFVLLSLISIVINM